jgi:hypothetical protein
MPYHQSPLSFANQHAIATEPIEERNNDNLESAENP